MTQPDSETGAQSSAPQPGKRMEIFRSWALWPLLILLTAFALSGTRQVPFHPDESTQLYMSRDFDLLLSNPLSLAWTPDQSGDGRLHLRLVDAPLTKSLLGLGRSLAGLPALPGSGFQPSLPQGSITTVAPDRQLALPGSGFRQSLPEMTTAVSVGRGGANSSHKPRKRLFAARAAHIPHT